MCSETSVFGKVDRNSGAFQGHFNISVYSYPSVVYVKCGLVYITMTYDQV